MPGMAETRAAFGDWASAPGRSPSRSSVSGWLKAYGLVDGHGRIRLTLLRLLEHGLQQPVAGPGGGARKRRASAIVRKNAVLPMLSQRVRQMNAFAKTIQE